MTKEMYVASTPHETKVAVVEDDQLAEIFYERENEYTLAGSIYKGRVTRVLPGMQSAFVDIGLERDAFLYVSDFLDFGEEEEDEFEEVPVRPETYVTNKPQQESKSFDFQKESPRTEHATVSATPQAPVDEETLDEAYSEIPDESDKPGESGEDESNRQLRGGRRRRRGRRGRGFPESKFARGPQREEVRPETLVEEEDVEPAAYEPIVLPGESISKYQKSKASEVEVSDEPTIEVTDEPESTPQGEAAFVIEGGFDSEVAEKEYAEPEGPAKEQTAVEGAKAPTVTPTVAPRPVQAAAPAPILLPGESIAKYSKKVEAPTPVVEEKPEGKANAPTAVVAPPPPPPSVTAVPDLSTAVSDSPFILPGESLAKYSKKAPVELKPAAEAEKEATPVTEMEPSPEIAAQEEPEAPAEETPVAEAPATETAVEEKQEAKAEEPRTEVRVEHRGSVAPFILPGESIAKYRRLAEAKRKEEERAKEAKKDIEPQPAEELASEAAQMVSENESLPETLEHQIESETEEAAAENADIPVEATVEEQPVGEAEIASESAAEQEEQAASVEEETAQSELEVSSAAAEEGEFASDFVPAELVQEAYEQTDEERHGYHAGAGHTLEQEEIDEDELDYILPEEEEPGDYVEVEEETFEANSRGDSRRQEIVEANGLSEAVEDAALDEETTEAEYPERTTVEGGAVEIETPGDEDEEFEESEMESGVAATESEPRGGSYKQQPGRPQFDRRGRGRRGGRRMRGGGAGTRRENLRPLPQISDLLKEGQEVLIQIAKEPIGKKGARITSHIALPGRYLVYMPTVNHIGVSRKINSEEERQRLKRIMISEREGGHGGFIVRTAAEGVTEEELRADIRFLKNLWHDIKTRSENSKAPALIYHDLNLVERVLRDQVTADFSAIWVDSETEYERILRFAQRFQPQLVRKVKLYTKNTPLYEQFGIQPEIDKALKSKVWLKSGGYIVINQTEALVAIDVNTGKYVGKTSRLEDTIVKTNVDAIKEIVRQVRLRDLGGIIVVDFIDMDERKNRQKVMQALEEAMKADRAPSKVLAFNDFGLVAITRKRVKQSLERTLGEPCPYCTGTGLVKSLTTVCNEIFVEMRKMAAHLEQNDVILRVNPEIAKALKAGGGKRITEMEELTRKTILVKSDPLLHQENFDIEG